MATTVAGSTALQNKLSEIYSQIIATEVAVGSLKLNVAKIQGRLNARIEDSEAPKESKIVPLQGLLASLQGAVSDAADAIEVPTAPEFQSLANS
jgi:hypothetical protein|tara:strand:- start:1276 stop:1557 length:282 start_codon:yes stop_codon:yes gene_type:complete